MNCAKNFVYWIKWVITYATIKIYNAFHKRRFDLYDVKAVGDPVKVGFAIPQLEKDLESPHPESHLQESADEVLFYGVNSKSECLLVRVARGSNQVTDAWIYLKLANGKTYRLVESLGHQQPFEGKCTNFSCGKLQMHYLSPMRKWRIFYCGMLKEASSAKNDIEETVFVKFVFLWTASSDVYDMTPESNPDGFANALARAEWESQFIPPINNVVQAMNFYAQSGVINGTVSMSDGDDYELYLFGEKMRNIGKKTRVVECKFTNILGNTPRNGFTFHLGKVSVPYLFNNLPYGFVVQPDTTIKAVKETDLDFQAFDEKSEKIIKVDFIAGDNYELRGQVIGDPIVLSSGHGWDGFVEVSFIEFTVGNKKGSGLIMSGQVSKKSSTPTNSAPTSPIPENVPLTVLFSDEMSNFGEISGGKGSSLGKLTKLSRKEKTFTVPKGTVVTTAAYQYFLTPEILNSVKHLEKVVYGSIEGDVKEACDIVLKTIVNATLKPNVCMSILKDLKYLFGKEIDNYRFAIRSSSTGEDTAAMSAAGQMDTFLGVKGLEEIFLCVKKCWASQFGHIAVEYKKRYGQILNSPMAVVIQEMVNCEVSGVLFTCDPVTNNPSVVTITANYGLGETVVSGTVEPDTITLKRDSNGSLKFSSVLVGAKHQKLVMKESGGTITESIHEEAKAESCLTRDLSERLGNIAIKIEDYYNSSRDIEWGITDGKVYILQSRPVTNAAAETEFEMKHELDSPMRCENEYYTIANIGEVMPGAASPLGSDLVFKYFSNIFKRLAAEKGNADNLLSSKYFPSGFLMFYNHLMLTVAEAITRYGLDTPMSKGLMISIFGRILDDPDLMAFVREKVPPGEEPKQSILQNIQYYWELFFHDWGTGKVKGKVEKYPSNFLKKNTAKKTFIALLNSCSDFDEAGCRHINSSESSSNWNMALFQLLKDANKGCLDSDVYSDFARLLAISCNVESANAPQALEEVAVQIVKDIDSEKFKSMSVEEALQWLEKSESESGHKFRQFIKRHGHRCLKESDVRSITWGMDPRILVKRLQNLAGVTKKNKKRKEDDYEQLFSELHVPLGFLSKCKLKFVLPNCRKAIRGREAGKSLTMKCFNYWRQGFRHLAKQMVAEGRIPDTDFIFFLTLDEIQDLLDTRAPSIISRAHYRRKMQPTLDEYMFPEIMRGIPKSINGSDESADTYEYIADLTLKGIPVSQGVAKGYARVALTLEEASHLKNGEILITHSTDIGWSPYFPIISGVVTELGGLISHGAVVSREYGLPCVVGLQSATRQFHTGDYVLLDGKKGILQRLPQPEIDANGVK